MLCNYLETQIAMVEIGSGAAVVPAYVASACAKRRITMHAIIDPAVSSDLYLMASRARELSSAAKGFNAFLKVHFSELAEQWPSRSARPARASTATA